MRVFAVALALATAAAQKSPQRGKGDTSGSAEASKAPRPGTSCRLLERQVLTAVNPPVHRLRFELPSTALVPSCCNGAPGLTHVRVKAPDAVGQTMRLKPYSAHVDFANRTFDIVVKIYLPDDQPSAAVSAYLGAVPIGDMVHVPELRAWDWRRESRRMGMVCLGVGITECVALAEPLLLSGAEVRMVYANRDAAHAVLVPRLRALLHAHPSHFRLRHCISTKPADDTNLEPGPSRPGERTTHGRVSPTVLEEEFGGAWGDGSAVEHFLVVGSPTMEQAVLGMLGRARLVDLAALRGHPPWFAMKGPYGVNSEWTALSPPEPARDAEHKVGRGGAQRTEL